MTGFPRYSGVGLRVPFSCLLICFFFFKQKTAYEIVYHGYFDIGIAVSSPRGLVVPIVRNCDQLSFADIEKQIADFGKRAQEGKLTIEELTGGTFSISNGGGVQPERSHPQIQPART